MCSETGEPAPIRGGPRTAADEASPPGTISATLTSTASTRGAAYAKAAPRSAVSAGSGAHTACAQAAARGITSIAARSARCIMPGIALCEEPSAAQHELARAKSHATSHAEPADQNDTRSTTNRLTHVVRPAVPTLVPRNCISRVYPQQARVAYPPAQRMCVSFQNETRAANCSRRGGLEL